MTGLLVLLAGCTSAMSDDAIANAAADSAQAAAAGVASTAQTAAAGNSSPAGDAAAKRSMGNGEKNWIVTEGAVRRDKTITFREVQIDGNGWLVMHPFEDGKPNGDKYVASTYVTSGSNKNVEIEVHKGATTGEMFIVMLHRDLNENKVFDFVFVDEVNVMDKAVFEGLRMIGHAVPSP